MGKNPQAFQINTQFLFSPAIASNEEGAYQDDLRGALLSADRRAGERCSPLDARHFSSHILFRYEQTNLRVKGCWRADSEAERSAARREGTRFPFQNGQE